MQAIKFVTHSRKLKQYSGYIIIGEEWVLLGCQLGGQGSYFKGSGNFWFGKSKSSIFIYFLYLNNFIKTLTKDKWKKWHCNGCSHYYSQKAQGLMESDLKHLCIEERGGFLGLDIFQSCYSPTENDRPYKSSLYLCMLLKHDRIPLVSSRSIKI